MNPLFSRFHNSQNQPNLQEFMAQTNPQDAKNRLQQMMQNGQLTQDQLSQLYDRAKQVMSFLGLK